MVCETNKQTKNSFWIVDNVVATYQRSHTNNIIAPQNLSTIGSKIDDRNIVCELNKQTNKTKQNKTKQKIPEYRLQCCIATYQISHTNCSSNFEHDRSKIDDRNIVCELNKQTNKQKIPGYRLQCCSNVSKITHKLLLKI